MKLSDLSRPIFLCGMMGSGKSTIGKIMAHKTGLHFQDLDHIIEDGEKMSIPEIFSKRGETYFRKTEEFWLIHNSQTLRGILALGGGSLQHQQLVDHIKMYGWLIFLDSSSSVLYNRLKKSKNRPMLSAGDDLKKRIDTLLEKRRPFYEQAHITIKTDSLKKNEIVTELINKIKLYEGRN
ncbi:MAG: shikimate kinase [Balneolaceae bacterium]